MKKILFVLSLACLPFSGLTNAAPASEKTAIFAGGCFWCMESDFEGVPGVIGVVSGYSGGEMASPTYRNHGRHLEVVRVTYDDEKVSYAQLLHTYWRSVDPTDDGGQFCDRGHAYTTAVFVADERERRLAEASRAEAERKLGQTIVTPIRDAGPFTDAEDYHQDYYKSDVRQLTRFGFVTRAKAYKGYREGCGRDKRVRSVWGDQAYQGVSLTH